MLIKYPISKLQSSYFYQLNVKGQLPEPLHRIGKSNWLFHFELLFNRPAMALINCTALFRQGVFYGYLLLLRRLVPGVMPRICFFNVWISWFGKPQYSIFSFSPLMIDRLSRHHIEIVNMEAYNAKNSVGFWKTAQILVQDKELALCATLHNFSWKDCPSR